MASIINTSLLPNKSWEWTITSKMGDMLQKAEAKYGERDKTYTILGIELSSVGNPYIWYLGDRKQIIIRINEFCLNDMDYAVFQVSQEIIHCLCPTGGSNATYLEEGLATHFGNEYYRSCGYVKWHVNDPKYIEALNLVEQLFRIDAEIIKKVRNIEPIISLVTKNQLIDVNKNIPECLADKLIKLY